jgi:putative salt-induced outer membrane protein YdiY
MVEVIVRFAESALLRNAWMRGYWLTLLMVSVFMCSAARADEVIMKNGDRLQGEVVSMAQGKLMFKTVYAGEIAIAWDQVARLTTNVPLVIELKDGTTLEGNAVTAEEGTLVLKKDTAKETSPINMATVRQLELPKPLPTWEYEGRISAGLSWASGNTETQKYDGIGELKISKEPHIIRMYAEVNVEKALEETTKDNSKFYVTYERFLTDKWYLFGNATGERDKFKDLNLQANFGAGPGYRFWKSKEKNLSFQIGPNYVIQRYGHNAGPNGISERDFLAGFWAVDFDMWFFNRFMQLFHHNDGLVDVSDTEVWMVRTRSGLRIPLISKLFASLQYNFDYQNSPAQTKKKYDEEYIFQLGWEF